MKASALVALTLACGPDLSRDRPLLIHRIVVYGGHLG
jgi:hypothetical protein